MTTVEAPAGPTEEHTGADLRELLLRAPRSRFAGIWYATAALFFISWLTVPGAFDPSTLKTMLPFAGALMIASAGQMLVIQGGGMDMSVPGVIGLSAMIVTRFPDMGGIVGSSVVAIVACVLAGILSGLIVVYLRFSPIIATLAVNALLVGIILQMTGGFSYVATDELTAFVSASIVGVPRIFLFAVVWVAILAWLMRKMTIGRRLVAVGVNRDAARAGGMPTNLYAIGSYAVGALCYGIVGILLAGLLNIPGATVGNSYLILTFAAVVLGGSPLLGGEGSIIATAVGALFLTQLNQMVLNAGGSASTQFLVQGAVIAASLILTSSVWRRAFPSVSSRISRLGARDALTAEGSGP